MAAVRPILASGREKPASRRRSPISTLESACHFDIWGCRGSRSLVPRRSSIGNNTSCYSILSGEDLLVLDAGRGLAALGHALTSQSRFESVRRVHVFITHAHMDHWEGLKDADWFWYRDNGLRVKITAPQEALDAIRSGYDHPSYVPLELLSQGTLERLEFQIVSAGDRRGVGRWRVRTGPLNHYSGAGDDIHELETVGYRLTLRNGPTVAYLCDHEPTEATTKLERRLIGGAHLALYDAHFPNLSDHKFGHGSQEHAAGMAREHPGTLILAAHHGPALSDSEIRGAMRRHGRGLGNYHVAVEGRTYLWNPRRGAFVLRLRAAP